MDNVINYIPVTNEKIKTKEEENLVVLVKERNNFFDNFMNRIFSTPRELKINLDELGSKAWLMIDGQSSIYDISKKIEVQLDKDEDKLIDRLILFFRYLYNNDLIKFRKAV
ncbi:PqqD family protein [Peptostreptococcaceae bacterium AGR-M142]